jgi:hypothetical protein
MVEIRNAYNILVGKHKGKCVDCIHLNRDRDK